MLFAPNTFSFYLFSDARKCMYIRKNDSDLFVEQRPSSRLQINRKEYDMIAVLKDGVIRREARGGGAKERKCYSISRINDS